EVVMKRLMPLVWCGSIVVAYLAGHASGPAPAQAQTPSGGARSSAPSGQPQPSGGALPPGDYSKMQLAPDQGEPTLFSGDVMRKAHAELQARSARGQAVSNPRDLLKPMVTRTHSFILLHRPDIRNPANQGANAEQHEGVT